MLAQSNHVLGSTAVWYGCWLKGLPKIIPLHIYARYDDLLPISHQRLFPQTRQKGWLGEEVSLPNSKQ